MKRGSRDMLKKDSEPFSSLISRDKPLKSKYRESLSEEVIVTENSIIRKHSRLRPKNIEREKTQISNTYLPLKNQGSDINLTTNGYLFSSINPFSKKQQKFYNNNNSPSQEISVPYNVKCRTSSPKENSSGSKDIFDEPSVLSKMTPSPELMKLRGEAIEKIKRKSNLLNKNTLGVQRSHTAFPKSFEKDEMTERVSNSSSEKKLVRKSRTVRSARNINELTARSSGIYQSEDYVSGLHFFPENQPNVTPQKKAASISQNKNEISSCFYKTDELISKRESIKSKSTIKFPQFNTVDESHSKMDEISQNDTSFDVRSSRAIDESEIKKLNSRKDEDYSDNTVGTKNRSEISIDGFFKKHFPNSCEISETGIFESIKEENKKSHIEVRNSSPFPNRRSSDSSYRKFSVEKYINKRLPSLNFDREENQKKFGKRKAKKGSFIKNLTNGRWRSVTISNAGRVNRTNSFIFSKRGAILSFLKMDSLDSTTKSEYENKVEKIEKDLEIHKKESGADSILVSLDQLKDKNNISSTTEVLETNNQYIFHKDVDSTVPQLEINDTTESLGSKMFNNKIIKNDVDLHQMLPNGGMKDSSSAIVHINDLDGLGELNSNNFFGTEALHNIKDKSSFKKYDKNDRENKGKDDFCKKTNTAGDNVEEASKVNLEESLSKYFQSQDSNKNHQVNSFNNAVKLNFTPTQDPLSSTKKIISDLYSKINNNNNMYKEMGENIVNTSVSGSGWVEKTHQEHKYHYLTALKAKRRSNNTFNIEDLPFPGLSNIYDYKLIGSTSESKGGDRRSLSLTNLTYENKNQDPKNPKLYQEKSKRKNSKDTKKNGIGVKRSLEIKRTTSRNSRASSSRKVVNLIKFETESPKSIQSDDVLREGYMNITLSPPKNEDFLESSVNETYVPVNFSKLKNRYSLRRSMSNDEKSASKKWVSHKGPTYLELPSPKNTRSSNSRKGSNDHVSGLRADYRRSGKIIDARSASLIFGEVDSNDCVREKKIDPIIFIENISDSNTAHNSDFTKNYEYEIKKQMSIVFPKLDFILESKPDLFKTLAISNKEKETLINLIRYLDYKKTKIGTSESQMDSRSLLENGSTPEYREFNLPTLSKAQMAKLKKMGLISSSYQEKDKNKSKNSNQDVRNEKSKTTETKLRVRGDLSENDCNIISDIDSGSYSSDYEISEDESSDSSSTDSGGNLNLPTTKNNGLRKISRIRGTSNFRGSITGNISDSTV
ncbi:hypothetical protein AYI68_g5429 [Smittium mucronatum]|uniref:Uncharacterized protein n=1 Tax=Smittium mucronatum TaxID=133383 RepID=A0A1R0GU99_9FUNG|nr:hypothetical protein AYI68_g5429 [Smittium mucronatum]